MLRDSSRGYRLAIATQIRKTAANNYNNKSAFFKTFFYIVAKIILHLKTVKRRYDHVISDEIRFPSEKNR